MIKDVSELLAALRSSLMEQAASEGVDHPGVVGEMYEEAAARLLRTGSAFEGLGLHVATGLIEDASGTRSRQVDCMVCVGEGKRIGLTRHRIYRAEDVLMVVEVKKTLRSKDLADALSWFRDFSTRLVWDGPLRMPNLFEISWANLTARPYPDCRATLLGYTVFERLVFGLLAKEARLPARVLFAFEGYRDEPSLRAAVIRSMDKLGGVPAQLGGEITAFPNLVVCGRAAVLKLDGFPYPGIFDEQAQTWAWAGSNSLNPFLSLLEILWTRLRARFGLSSSIFGKDLDVDTVTWFGSLETLDASTNSFGLFFHPDSEPGPTVQSGVGWRPAEITEAEFQVLKGMEAGLTPDFESPEFVAFLNGLGLSEEALVQSFRSKGIAGLDGGLLVPLVDGLKCVDLLDGTYLAGDDSTGRLTAYLARSRNAG